MLKMTKNVEIHKKAFFRFFLFRKKFRENKPNNYGSGGCHMCIHLRGNSFARETIATKFKKHAK